MKLNNLPIQTEAYGEITLNTDGTFYTPAISGKLVIDGNYFRLEGEDHHIPRHTSTAIGALLKLLNYET